MKKPIKCKNLFLKITLLLFPLIPYNVVVPEVINPLAFLILAMIFIFQMREGINKKDIYWLLLFLISFITVIISKDKLIVFMNSFNTLIIIPTYLIGKKIKKDELSNIFSFILYGGMLNAFFSILRYLSNKDSRLDGIFNYANSSALYFTLCIIIYIYASWESKTEHTWDNKFSIDGEKIKEFGVIIIGSALFLTQSRAAIIIYVLSLIYILIIYNNKKERLIINISNFAHANIA